MSAKLFPERLYEAGFTDLVSVIPPGAQLAPSSKIPQNAIGKIPGRRLSSGLWAGYNWRKDVALSEDVRRWSNDGANVGLRAGLFPAVDIDCLDPIIVQQVRERALAVLGPAPVRIGRAPKALLMYRTAEPFGRMRLILRKPNGEQGLVEILGEGQQYLVHGTHPNTGLPYAWEQDPTTFDLTTITGEQARAFLDALADELALFYVVDRVGDGRKNDGTVAADQEGLVAPSIEMLAEAVSLIPNDDTTAPGRDEYIQMGYAIRAAGGDDHEQEAFEVFAAWAGKHEADGRVGGNPETWLSDWRRIRGPYKLGWNWIAELARAYGFNDASSDFEAIEPTPDTTEATPVAESEQDLARRIIERNRNILRYVPQKGCWLVWENSRWRIDAELLAEDIIKRGLRDIADKVARRGATPKEQKEALIEAKAICSATKLKNVMTLIRSDRAIAVAMESLDHDPWVLNTPAGLVDLRTGEVAPPNPDALCSKITAVAPDFSSECSEWKRFLTEATGDDAELQSYLQRLAGYALTGSTKEQQFAFIWGTGGNGKSVFIDTVREILGDGYATTAAMETFTATRGEKHPTALARLMGARLVAAEETEAGKRWDESQLKSVTGGGMVTARFMGKDFFEYKPQFKLVFTGNHRPELRDVGDAMRRRIQMVPFNVKPKRVDMDLRDKLRAEAPAILAWMIEGCLAWQKQGTLAPPTVVRAFTTDYFETEDALGRWVAECCTINKDATATTDELFQSWREWTNRNNEYTGKMKGFVEQLKSRKLARWTEPGTRRRGFIGIRVEKSDNPLFV